MGCFAHAFGPHRPDATDEPDPLRRGVERDDALALLPRLRARLEAA